MSPFRNQCRRRPAPERTLAARPFGAGSGGDGPDGDGGYNRYYDGDFVIGSRQVHLASIGGTGTKAGSPDISLLAGSLGGSPDGTVEIRGYQGVRITAGPPPGLDSVNESINGIEIATGETQTVSIKRGLVEDVDQVISMETDGITVDAGKGTATIMSLTEVRLAVAGGTSYISLTPSGITIFGPMVNIN